MICSCHQVGVNTIKQAVIAGAATVQAIGGATAAGTNCGSCRMEIQQILAAIQLPQAI